MAEDYVFLDTFRPTPFFDWAGIGLFVALLTLVCDFWGAIFALLMLYIFGWD